MRKWVCAALLAVGFSTPALAVDIVCNVRDTGDGFMSPVIVFRFPDGAGETQVFDVFIEHVYGAPIKARVRQRQNGDTILSWRVSNIPARPSPATIGYRAVLNPQRTSVAVTGSLRGVINSINGQGQCGGGKIN